MAKWTGPRQLSPLQGEQAITCFPGLNHCIYLALVIRPRRVRRFPIRGPKWPKKHSPGFTLGNSSSRHGPEGARYGENRLRTFERDLMRISSPFRAKPLFRLTHGKPWAMLSCPFRAYDRRSTHTSGQETSQNLR